MPTLEIEEERAPLPLRGNTYPHREKLKALGCTWCAEEKCWVGPRENWDMAWDLVHGVEGQLSMAELML